MDIITRYVGFYRSLVRPSSYEVAVLAGLVGQDIRSTTGSNLRLRLLRELTGLEPIAFGSSRLKEALIQAELV